MMALLPGTAALTPCGARSSLDSGLRDFFEKVHLDDDTLTVCSCVPDLPAP